MLNIAEAERHLVADLDDLPASEALERSRSRFTRCIEPEDVASRPQASRRPRRRRLLEQPLSRGRRCRHAALVRPPPARRRSRPPACETSRRALGQLLAAVADAVHLIGDRLRLGANGRVTSSEDRRRSRRPRPPPATPANRYPSYASIFGDCRLHRAHRRPTGGGRRRCRSGRAPRESTKPRDRPTDMRCPQAAGSASCDRCWSPAPSGRPGGRRSCSSASAL